MRRKKEKNIRNERKKEERKKKERRKRKGADMKFHKHEGSTKHFKNLRNLKNL